VGVEEAQPRTAFWALLLVSYVSNAARDAVNALATLSAALAKCVAEGERPMLHKCDFWPSDDNDHFGVYCAKFERTI